VEAYWIVIDGNPVARASSSRSDDAAAELWIETDPDHRRRGYATRVALAWATGVRQAGKTPFYSHLHDNAASAALARRLGVSPLFEIIAINLT
jgi:predicted GNAT family acetyltransferase